MQNSSLQTLILKLVHTFSQVNCNTETILDQGVRLVPDGHILTCFASGALCLDIVHESQAC